MNTNTSSIRSSRNPTYDSGESRRSPRDRSPARYNEARPSDLYRGSMNRGNGERRRSIEDLRIHHSNFSSSRDTFREPTARENSREFPPREPPRGPKALIDVPSGPRATSYSADFRNDFSFRGDFRGRGSRGRGRAWRDESRDRGRDVERDFRERRDERGGLPQFRDDRSRDRERWERDAFRGRRPSSPSARGRSPTYANRDSRDPPPNLDAERTHKAPRDGPPSIPSPSSESLLPFGRGYGRGRVAPARGRGRGFYDEFHRQVSGRSRSPEASWNRRTQASSTPPPQVPAFGSTSTNAAAAPSGPSLSSVSAPVALSLQSPVTGVPVPTAPRSQRLGRGNLGLTIVAQKVFTGQKEQPMPRAAIRSPSKAVSPASTLQAPAVQSLSRPSGVLIDRSQVPRPDQSTNTIIPTHPKVLEAVPYNQPQSSDPPVKRRPTIGKRAPNVPLRTREDSTDSESDSGDDFDDEYFEDEISKAEIRIRECEGGSKRKLTLPPIPDAIFVKPFIEYAIDDLVAAAIATEADACPVPEQGWPMNTTLLRNQGQSVGFNSTNATQPLPSVENSLAAKGKNFQTGTLNLQVHLTNEFHPLLDDQAPLKHGGQSETQLNGNSTTWKALDNEIKTGPSAVASGASISGAAPGTQATVEKYANSSGTGLVTRQQLTASELEQLMIDDAESLEVVRKMMATPPLTSLPKFGCKKWSDDGEFLATLASNPAVEQILRMRSDTTITRRRRQQEEERQRWKERYLKYRRWTDYSMDPVAIRGRDAFARSRASAAANATVPAIAAIPTAGSKPEGQRRAGSRFGTEADVERVMRESEREAKTKERADRFKTATAKEARVPDMCWDEEERLEDAFIDRTHIVPFERSFANLEFGEPIDNFTEEESQMFEKMFLDFPKQWSKIASALPSRDYKACIQHYYLIKPTANLKEKLKKHPKKRKGRVARGPKPNKQMMLAGSIANRDDADDGQDTENGNERRRPRRAAAPVWPFEESKNDSDASTPVATPGRKPAATPKADNGNDAAPSKKKVKVAREKGVKGSKNSQLLAAAPVPANRLGESPGPPTLNQDWKNRREPAPASRYITQFEGTTQIQPTFAPPYVPAERPAPTTNVNFEIMAPTFVNQDQPGTHAPTNLEPQQGQRSMQQTSSYWSVPEVTDFPALLRHFGTDWHGIAKFMASKTHIMVKNYYQRQVESGRMSSWEAIARDADEKRERGESTGPLPTPTVIPKRRYDSAPGPIQRSGSVMDGLDELTPPRQEVPAQQISPPQPSLSTRFPALAQAGPVPQSLSQTVPPSSVLNKASPSQVSRQSQAQQQSAQQSRTSRGPSLGYFNAEPQRPILQATAQHSALSGPPPTDSAISQRSLMVAQQAQLEQQQALRTIQEQQQQQAMQRERQGQMKQENEPAVHQYEPFPTPAKHTNLPAQSRPEFSHNLSQPDSRRPAAPQPYQPHSHQLLRGIMPESANPEREPKASAALIGSRTSSNVATSILEQHTPQRPAFSGAPSAPQVPPPPPVVRQEPARKSNIMSLLNDEPSEPTPQQHKRLSDISSGLQSSRTQSQQPQQSSRPPLHQTQPSVQHPPQMPQKMMAQVPHQQQQIPQTQQQYSQAAAPPSHHHTSSAGVSRSYTPTNFDRGYGPPPALQQQQQHHQQQQQSAPQQVQQQQHYSQATRQPISQQPPSIRREPSHPELQGVSGYPRASAPPQPSMRLKESPYATTPPASQQVPQTGRQHHGSPHDIPPASEREYYSRTQQYMMQQTIGAASPQIRPTYQPQPQQPGHRQLGFGQTPSRLASPPNQYAAQQVLQRPRQNSFDNRHPPASAVPLVSSGSQQGYSSASHNPAPSLGMQYQQPQPMAQDRHTTATYERDARERELRELREMEAMALGRDSRMDLERREYLREAEAARERELRERGLREQEMRERERRERKLQEEAYHQRRYEESRR